MSVIYLVLPVAIVMAAVALAAFFWAVHRGQFDDLDTPAHRMLLDDDATGPADPAKPPPPRRRRRRG